MSIPFLQSERIFFRPYEEADLEHLYGWLNDSEVTHFMFYGQLPWTREQVKAFIEKDLANPNNIIFVCMMKGKEGIEGNCPIGFCGLYDWHRTARKAEARILIGNKNQWGKGIGTEIVELLTWFGFDRINLNRIYLGFTVANEAAAHAYGEAGYSEEGVLRDDIYRNGRYYDSVRMAILYKDYKRRQIKQEERFGLKLPGFLIKDAHPK